MKAVLLESPREALVRDLPVPTLEPGDLLVEMRVCGLCGSDLEKIQGEYTAALPVIGHEAVGVVTAVGPDVASVEVDTRVFPHHHVPCYDCVYCRAGSETMCSDYRKWHLDPGGFSELFRVPKWIVDHGGVLTLPDSVSFEEGSFVEPLACCVRALNRMGVPKGGEVLIAGAGPMGLMILQLLLLRGAGGVVVSEPSPYRLEFAEGAGAEAVVNPLEEDVVEMAQRLTDGRGVDLAVVATGSPQALREAVRAVRRGGKVGLVGIPEANATLDGVSELVTREVSIVSSNAATEEETREALKLIVEGRVDVSSLVTHRVPLSRFSQAVKLAQRAESMKVLVVP